MPGSGGKLQNCIGLIARLLPGPRRKWQPAYVFVLCAAQMVSAIQPKGSLPLSTRIRELWAMLFGSSSICASGNWCKTQAGQAYKSVDGKKQLETTFRRCGLLFVIFPLKIPCVPAGNYITALRRALVLLFWPVPEYSDGLGSASVHLRSSPSLRLLNFLLASL